MTISQHQAPTTEGNDIEPLMDLIALEGSSRNLDSDQVAQASVRDATSVGLAVLGSLRQASLLGPRAVMAAAGRSLASVVGASEGVFVSAAGSSDGVWELVSGDGSGSGLGGRVGRLGSESLGWCGLVPVEDLDITFVALRPGRLGFIVPVVVDPGSDSAALVELCAQAVELVVSNAERIHEMEEVVAELAALENVAIEILSVREVDQVLLSIARKAMGLLESDMSGVLLLESGGLVMRSSIGHRSVETARLRMRVGQGVAGRVLETGEPCKVDSYLESESITHDFDPLARVEDTRSALGAPLKVHGEVIGVLEVWRRRDSLFTDRHVRRLVALANLAAIAIENARLYDRQQESMRQLATAQDSLSRQLHVLQEAGNLQRALLQLLLEGEGLSAIVRTIAAQVGGQIAVFSNDFEVLSWYPRGAEIDRIGSELRRVARATDTRTGAVKVVLGDDRWFTVQAIRAGRDGLGWFCLLSDAAPGTKVEIAIGEAALSCALSQLEQRAADQARSEARDEILWDLLEGSDDHRLSALSRAKRLHIDLSRPHRVIRGVIDDFDEAVRAEGWDSSRVERLRRELGNMAQRVLAEHGSGELVSIRRNALVAAVPLVGPTELCALVGTLRHEIIQRLPAVTSLWGVSAPHEDPMHYQTANKEAQISLRAARRMGGEGLALYDQLGIVRLLLASHQEADLSDFVHDILGPLIEHDQKHDATLTETLRAYFDADCSQQIAAKTLYVHHKTLRYRLDRIESLTGLDLRKHDHRIHADLALKIREVMQMITGEPDSIQVP